MKRRATSAEGDRFIDQLFYDRLQRKQRNSVPVGELEAEFPPGWIESTTHLRPAPQSAGACQCPMCARDRWLRRVRAERTQAAAG